MKNLTVVCLVVYVFAVCLAGFGARAVAGTESAEAQAFAADMRLRREQGELLARLSREPQGAWWQPMLDFSLLSWEPSQGGKCRRAVVLCQPVQNGVAGRVCELPIDYVIGEPVLRSGVQLRHLSLRETYTPLNSDFRLRYELPVQLEGGAEIAALPECE